MKFAVAGGTGLVGGGLVRRLQSLGEPLVVIARSAGLDVETGEGLDAALAGVDTVVDVLNTAAVSFRDVVQFFARSSERLLAAERPAEVRHHVLLSIIGAGETREYAHFAGKLAQENAVATGGVPFTIVRATQFFEFAEQSVKWGQLGDRASIPPLLMQPISVSDAAAFLAEYARAAPVGGVVQIAGPERHDLVDVSRRTLQARGQSLTSIHRGSRVAPVEMASDLLLPHEGRESARKRLRHGWSSCPNAMRNRQPPAKQSEEQRCKLRESHSL